MSSYTIFFTWLQREGNDRVSLHYLQLESIRAHQQKGLGNTRAERTNKTRKKKHHVS